MSNAKFVRRHLNRYLRVAKTAPQTNPLPFDIFITPEHHFQPPSRCTTPESGALQLLSH
nr:hypothetical protein [Lelliottia aquatilis]